MFDKILIANRGEIACRIIRSCRRLGVWAVAVYSEADAGARHVREADEALCIGPARAQASYLDAQAVVDAARHCGAQAIHPGYGFLSERLALVDACRAAGITFIGPHAQAIASMGSKIESKRIARAAGVPCVPGYDGDDQRLATLRDQARRIGLPLLIKASAGGGGKGVRRVEHADELAGQLATAQAEAQAAFGDAKVLLERFVARPRHVEVQLLGDRHGRLLHLFERECSIQRNYQKLVEETPAPHLDAALKARLFDAALALGRAIGYDSAGTVEFVLDADAADEPYFLEVNTRLQVEHPVTELTTGVDLVEWQMRVAAGEPLPWQQHELSQRGWAIEARVNAEDPATRFAPSLGPVLDYEEPLLNGVRIDSGIDARSEVTPHYDSLVAKVIGHGASRSAARRRLAQGLQQLRVAGLKTTQPLLLDVLRHPAFDDVLDTGFLARHWPQGWQPDAALLDEARAVAASAWQHAQRTPGDDRPLAALLGWRVTAPVDGPGRSHLVVHDGTRSHTHVLRAGATGTDVACDGLDLRVERGADGGWRCAGSPRAFRAQTTGNTVRLWCDGWCAALQVGAAVARAASSATTTPHDHTLRADLPGVLAQLMVGAGEHVRAGAPLAVLEAMKLFHTLNAPCDGVVRALPVAPGATVAQGATLIEFEPLTLEDH